MTDMQNTGDEPMAPTAANIVEINGQEEFDKFVADNADAYILFDFWAEWCGPCRAVAPIVDDIAETLGDQVKVAKVDIDQNQEIMMGFGIMSIPTLMLYEPKAEGSDERGRSAVTGFRPKPVMASWLQDKGVDVSGFAN